MKWKLLPASGIIPTLMLLAGCHNQTSSTGLDQIVKVTLAKLGDADQLLAEAQRHSAVQTHERLRSMGVPLKLDVQGQPVFVCCHGCEKKALGDPKATLARLASLKAGK